MNIHAEVKNAMRRAAPPLQEVPSSSVAVGPSRIRREDLEAPHIVLLDNPEQLHQAIGSFLDLSHAPNKIVPHILAQFEHEAEHYEAALGVGSAEIVQQLAIYSRGRGPFRRYGYHLGTAPLDVTDPGARAVIIGHPELLSEGDWKGLDEAGISLRGVAEIAAQKDWPMPLSLQQDRGNQMFH